MQPDAKPRLLPELRQELRLEQGAPGPSGQPTWLIVDPIQHRYIQVDDASYELLSYWQPGATFEALCQAMAGEFGRSVRDDDLAAFVKFLEDNHLTAEPSSDGWRSYAAAAQRAEHSWFMWLIHNYLFVKIPLFKPEAALRRYLPCVLPLYTRTFFVIVGSIGAAGLYLVSRQWDVFSSTFQHFFSLEGALTYAVALVVVKSAHELGHAFTAVRYGCRVPSMGICFLVMFPVLYTDVTDAWRLKSRKERLLIGGAGVTVELTLACLATFAWPFLAEGPLKSLAFSIATVGWVLSLVINLNPLMRFDGYYLFADALGIDNLQPRAFALGRWRMRELLFGLGDRPPEHFDAKTTRIMIGFAWAVWIYRLILFTGIALLVYHMTFKILGLILFAVEIIYFIAKPIAGELAYWWRERGSLAATPRTKITAALFVILLLAAAVPWSTRVYVPAILEAADLAHIYPQRAGLVKEVRVKPGDTVQAGDIIAVLASPEIDLQILVTRRRIALVTMRLARRSSDDEDRSRSLVMEREIISLKSTLAGLIREADELVIRSPSDGVVAELNFELHAGRAIGRSEFVALVKGRGSLVARGYLAERDIMRVQAGTRGRFIADLPGMAALSVTLKDIAQSGARAIELPELASAHGGAIAVRPHQGEKGYTRLVPVEAQYLAVMSTDAKVPAPMYAIRGVVQLDGETQSFISRAWRQAASVLVRESGI